MLVVLLFAATLVGLVMDFAMGPVERLLLRRTGILARNPDSKQWRAAWQVRWRSSGADSEFKRYEGIVSVARAYLFHSTLSGLFWCAYLRSITGVAILVGCALAAFVFGWMWKYNTEKIFLVVRAAHNWTKSEESEAV